MTTKQKVRATKGIKRAVKRLSEEERNDVLSNLDKPEESPKERIPGQVVRGTKTTWTKADMDRIYGICEFTPEETVPITINGIRYQCIAGYTMLCPTIVKQVYENRKRVLRESGKVLPHDLGYETIVELGAGALPPE